MFHKHEDNKEEAGLDSSKDAILSAHAYTKQGEMTGGCSTCARKWLNNVIFSDELFFIHLFTQSRHLHHYNEHFYSYVTFYITIHGTLSAIYIIVDILHLLVLKVSLL